MSVSGFSLTQTFSFQQFSPKRIELWDKFLTSLEFEISYTPLNFSSMKLPPIRDQADLPILASAVIAQPDILVTGDLDFYTPEILEYFKVLTPADFLRHFNNEFDH